MNDIGLLNEVRAELNLLMGNTAKYKEELYKQLDELNRLNKSVSQTITAFPTKYIERKLEMLDIINKSEKKNTTFILISGKAQHGKDTSARFFEEYLTSYGKKVVIAHYADLLKYICKMFFEWNGEKDEKGRTLLQQVGTDCIRKNDPDYWVRFIVDFVSMFPFQWDYVIIPDTRFPNEVDYVRRSGFNTKHVRILRPAPFDNGLTSEQKKHPSEVALDNSKPEFMISNDGDLDGLKEKIGIICKNIVLGE